jgi:MoaA/NifB/PqqE/SkfB family radical SAM enzyme
MTTSTNPKDIQFHFDSFQNTLSIYFSNKCNISCKHCGVKSGPHESGKLDINLLISQLSELVNLGKIRGLHIGGGEPYIYIQDMQRLAEFAQANGLLLAVNSNGFWARTEDKARKTLERTSGVTQLMLGTDSYHVGMIPLSSIQNAVRIATEKMIMVDVYICTAGGVRDDFVHAVEDLLVPWLDASNVHVGPVEAVGRASGLPEAKWRKAVCEPPTGHVTGLIDR